MTRPKLPEHLHGAYDFIGDAGELATFAALRDAALAKYIKESVDGTVDDGKTYAVDGEDLRQLHAWLTRESP